MADLRQISIPVPIADVGTAQTQIIAITAHNAGQLKRATHMLGAAISVADSLITIKKNGTALTGGTITVAYTSSAAGDIDFADFTNTFVVAGDYISVVNGGESTGAAPGCVTLDIIR